MACAAHLARSVLSGLAGGLAGAGAMSLGHRVAGAIVPKAEAPPASRQKDPTIKVASAITRGAGYELPRSQEPRAGSIVHYAFGGTVGALYGAAAGLVPKVALGLGLPFGVAVWLGAHVIAVPALSLSAPTRRPLRQEAEELGLHLVYGATTDLVRRLISGGSITWLSSVGSSSA
jgi:uncharacterized membrane protein YagU involved in acid resistance